MPFSFVILAETNEQGIVSVTDSRRDYLKFRIK